MTLRHFEEFGLGEFFPCVPGITSLGIALIGSELGECLVGMEEDNLRESSKHWGRIDLSLIVPVVRSDVGGYENHLRVPVNSAPLDLNGVTSRVEESEEFSERESSSKVVKEYGLDSVKAIEPFRVKRLRKYLRSLSQYIESLSQIGWSKDNSTRGDLVIPPLVRV